MTQQPYGQPPQGYPQPQQPGYAQPQYGQQPAPYQGQPAAQPAYAPPAPAQGYPPVSYPPQPQFQPPQYQQPPQAPPAPVQPATVRDFWEQPSSGGKNLPFEVIGTRYVMTVIRSVTDADIVVQTDIRDPSQVATYRDGRPKKMMLVPVLLHQPTPEFPDGQAVWYVKGNDKNELTRAMEAAGIAPDPETGFMPAPRAGDVIDITYTHDKPMGRGMNPMKAKHIVYTAGNGIGPALPTAQPPAQVHQPQYGYPPQNQPQFPGQPPLSPGQVAAAQAMQVHPGVQYPGTPQYAQTGPDTVVVQPPNFPPGWGPVPPQQVAPNGPYGQPNADWNPAAQFVPPGAFTQQPNPALAYQQPGPTAPPVSAAQPGAPTTAPASPSSPPPDWPADVPFRPGLTVEQARMAALHNIPQPQ